MAQASHLLAFASLSLVAAQPTAAATLELISRSDPAWVSDTPLGGPSDLGTQTVSADGRYWVFRSSGVNLVPGEVDHGQGMQVYLYDRVTNFVNLVSRAVGTAATVSDGIATDPVLSADGRWVAFVSNATNLVAGPPVVGAEAQVFLWDRLTQAITLVSHDASANDHIANGLSRSPRISGDGSFVAFASLATNLMAGQMDSAASVDIFLYDRASRQNVLVSRAQGAPATAANQASSDVSLAIGEDGRYVAFASAATNLVPGQSDANGRFDAFLYDRTTGGVTLVSRAFAGPGSTAANETSFPVALSADGRYLAYGSRATDLVAGQSGSGLQILLWDRLSGASTLVSHAWNAAGTGVSGDAVATSLSSDGRYLVFGSPSNELVAGQPAAGLENVFLFDRVAGTVTLASHAPGSAGNGGDGPSQPGMVSDNGRVAFESAAGNLVAGQQGAAGTEVFLFDPADGSIVLVSHAAGSSLQAGNGDAGYQTAISRMGDRVGFTSLAPDLDTLVDANFAPDFFVFDRASGSNRTVSRRDPGMASLAGGGMPQAVSPDGRWVAFASTNRHAVPNQQGAVAQNVYLYDRLTRTTLLASHAPGSPAVCADADANAVGVSADGRFLAFTSGATNLVAPALPAADRLYFYDRQSGQVSLVGPVSAPAGGGRQAVLSADGRFLAFTSEAVGLVPGANDGAGTPDVFLYDRAAGTFTLVSRTAADPQTAAGGVGGSPGLSADGRYVAFRSTAPDLVPGQISSGSGDVFLFDRLTGGTALVSHASGSPNTGGDAASDPPKISADGSTVAFTSQARNLIPGLVAAMAQPQLYLYDRASGTVTLASHADGQPATALGFAVGAFEPSADGRFAAFAGRDLYLYDREGDRAVLASHAAASPNAAADWPSLLDGVSADGRFVAYTSQSTNLVAGQVDGAANQPYQDVFLYDRTTNDSILVSRRQGTPTAAADNTSWSSLVSADGTTVLFASYASDLAGNDFNLSSDVYLFRRDTHPGRFFTLAPCRLLDTRQAGQGPALASGSVAVWLTYAACGIPSTARALSVNVTVVAPAGDGYLTLFAGDQPLPATSTINFRAGQVRANNAVLPLSGNGDGTLAARASLAGNGTVHLILDVNGYFE